jgi:DNA polymerase III subunit epsilon
MRQIFFDTETTGLSAENGDRIIEIGCIEMLSRRLSGARKHFYLNPQRPSHPDAIRIHGLTDEFLSDKPLFAEIADELLDFLAGADLVIHNAAFDIGFMNAELRRVGKPPLANVVARVTDSLTMAREMFPGKSNSLDALCKRLEVDNTNRALHGALLDAGLLAEVYIRLTRGQNSLVIDAADESRDEVEMLAVDLGTFSLPLLNATPEEVASHEALLADIDKACGGRALWQVAVA